MTVFSPFVRYFDEVARLGSIRKAAAYLNVAPSAVNKQILKLEEQLGERLFERHSRGLRLTRAGELLVYNIRRWQTDYGSVQTQIFENPRFEGGHVTLAVVEGSATGLVSGIVKSFIRGHADVALTIEVAPSDEVVRRVRNGDVDLGLSFNPPPHPSLRIEAKAQFRVGAVVTPGHALARRTSISLDTCLEHPLIVPDGSLMLRTVIDALMSPQVDRFVPQFTCNSIGVMKSLTKHGLGIGLLTELDVMTETDAGELVYIPFDALTPTSTLSLFVAANRHFQAAASLFIRFFAQQLTLGDAAVPSNSHGAR
jgi:DNA-binding transcriptional LysR family regulator